MEFAGGRQWRTTGVAPGEREKRLGAVDDRQGRQPVRNELLEIRNVLEVTVENKIEPAGHMMMRDDLRERFQRFEE